MIALTLFQLYIKVCMQFKMLILDRVTAVKVKLG